MDFMFYDGLPSCAISCANRTISLTPCGPNNVTSSCLCPEVEWQHAFGGCVMKECLPFDGLTARNVTLTHCGVPPRQTAEALGASAFLLALTVIAFSLRMLAKAIRLTPWGADDITIVIGFAAAIIFAVMKFIGRRFGFGLDFWTLRYDTIVEFMKIFYAFANVYTLAIAALKATILFFYQRVFGGFSSPFTTILWCTQTFNLLTFIGFTIPTIAQCQPLSFAWEGWDGRHEGFCLNILSMIVTHAAVNIGLDIWMLILPSTQVLRLNLRWREKAEILAMFGIGIFITAVSIIRLTVLLNLRNFENPTQDAFYLHMWSYIEISVGVIIASLPATRQLLRHWIPKSFRAIRQEAPRNMAQARPGDSTRTLRNTPITGLSVDQASPTSVEGFAASSRHGDDARQIMSSL